MLTARAYSFRQQARLAVSLSWIGGFVNAITFLESAQLFTSNLTGGVTMGGIALVQGAWGLASLLAEVCFAFLAGAMTSALLGELARQRRWKARYVAPVALEAALLGGACLLLELDLGVPRGVLALAAFAMGLQNATITTISGAVVRSTHVTGVVTDLGLESVQAWFWWRDPARRVRSPNGWRFFSASSWHPRIARLLLLGGILASFTLGVLMGALGHGLAPRLALLLPICFLVGIVFLDWHRPIGEIREIDPLGAADLREHRIPAAGVPVGVGLFWLGRSRPVGAHPDNEARHELHYRAPDFQDWMEGLPTQVRTPVLVLSPHVVLDTNAALDLAHVARRLREQGRRLCLAGLTAAQRLRLEQAGTLSVVGAEHVFPGAAEAVEALAQKAQGAVGEGLAGL